MTKQKILVVDDEPKIVNIVKAYLTRDGFGVVVAFDGQQALEIARRETPDLIVLDLMLPEISGWDVCRALRRESTVPIIMLTAREEVTDRIVGLEIGADDYVTKPFDPNELIARIRAVLRRVANAAVDNHQVEITAGNLRIDLERHEVRREGKLVQVTPSEFSLLSVLARNPGRVFSRFQLLELIQGDAYEGYERAIDSHVKNLRQKIEPDPRRPRYVLTVFGVGYKFARAEDA